MSAGALGGALLVGAGGFLGALARYGLSGLVHGLVPLSTFPWGTLAVNVSGCLAIGLVAGVADARSAVGPDLRLFLMIGLLGGFTTYSTFGYETLAMVRDGETLRAAGNVALQLVVGLGAAWAGYAMTGTR